MTSNSNQPSDRDQLVDMKLWFVDDKQDNHETWFNSFPDTIIEACELRSFLSVSEAMDEFARGNVPDILFLDFFIRDALGIRIIEWFRNQDNRPVLIAHSSMEEANLGIIREGADFHMEKLKNRPHTNSIRSAFRSIEDVGYIVKNRDLPMGTLHTSR